LNSGSIIAVLLFLIGVLYANEGNFTSSSDKEIITDLSGGDYLRFVYIGSSTCQFSNNEHAHQLVKSLKTELKSLAQQYSINFISTGISIDGSTKQGIKFLKKSGNYSEIISGASNFNLGSIQYASGAASTPQILLIHERYDTEVIGVNINDLNQVQQLINNYRGIFEIEEFHQFIKKSTREEVFKSLNLGYYLL
jgi:hypothetical protein